MRKKNCGLNWKEKWKKKYIDNENETNEVGLS